MSGFAGSKSEQSHHRLFDFAKTAIINIFAHPYTTVPNNPSSPHPVTAPSFPGQSLILYLSVFSRFASYTAAEIPTSTSGKLLRLVTTSELVFLYFTYLLSVINCTISVLLLMSLQFFFFFCLGEFVITLEASSSEISCVRESWESHRKSYDVEFFEADPSKVRPATI